ncbi:MAG: glycosyltransferase family 1 protein [Desulfobulbaceae bacterium]
MRVVFDYQIFALQQTGGISRYFLDLARSLARFCPEIEPAVVAPFHVSPMLEEEQRGGTVPVHGRRVPVFPGKHRVLPRLNSLVSEKILYRLRPDILHATYYHPRIPEWDGPRILTVYDMIHERFPHLFTGVDREVPRWKREAVARADHLIAISRCTRDDLVEMLDVEPEKITVISLAPSLKAPEGGGEKRVPCRERPYLLYVGLRGGVKNFATLLAAFSSSPVLRKDFDLVCVGGGPFTDDELRGIREQGVERRVTQVEADDAQLARLYEGASLFVYPSLYEGFGLPLLEAMRCGCPVACSGTSSMPEVAGEAALFFDPTDSGEMRVTLERIVTSPSLADELRARGRRREKEFGWEECARLTAAVYERCVREQSR